MKYFRTIRKAINEPHNLRSFTVIALFILAWIGKGLNDLSLTHKVIFWIEVADIGLLLLVANQKDKVESLKSQIQLLNETRSLRKVTRDAAKSFSTLPNERVLTEIDTMVQNAQYITITTLSDANKIKGEKNENETKELIDLYESRIRQVLNQIVTFAEMFDENDADNKVFYHINIMTKIDISDICGDETALLEQYCKFQDVGFSLRNNKSVLMLIPNLSTNTRCSKPEADEQDVICFDIPDMNFDDEGNIEHLLPGAPRALFTDYEEYSSTKLLVENCLKKNGVDITDYKAKQLESYFSEVGEDIQSFISIPIKTILAEKHEFATGVINIHRNKTHPTHEKYPAKSFVILSKPLILCVFYLLLSYEAEVPKFWKNYLSGSD